MKNWGLVNNCSKKIRKGEKGKGKKFKILICAHNIPEQTLSKKCVFPKMRQLSMGFHLHLKEFPH